MLMILADLTNLKDAFLKDTTCWHCTLWQFNIAIENDNLEFRVDFPMKHGDFLYSYVSHYQRLIRLDVLACSTMTGVAQPGLGMFLKGPGRWLQDCHLMLLKILLNHCIAMLRAQHPATFSNAIRCQVMFK